MRWPGSRNVNCPAGHSQEVDQGTAVSVETSVSCLNFRSEGPAFSLCKPVNFFHLVLIPDFLRVFLAGGTAFDK